jgi:uncharacterized membrane protein YgcG
VLKASNKMLRTYLAAIAILSVLAGVVPAGVMVAQASNDRNDDSPQNRACYNAGFADGRQNNPYSQTAFSQCGVNGRAYYEGFISGCISGQGKDFFSCQKLTGASFGGGGGSSGQGGGGGVALAASAVAAAVANRIGLKFKNLFLATLPNL